MYPEGGKRSPEGGENLKGWPEGVGMVSVIGLKLSEPEKAIAVTSSGEARKFMVRKLPSLRALKLRLKEVRMAVVLAWLMQVGL